MPRNYPLTEKQLAACRKSIKKARIAAMNSNKAALALAEGRKLGTIVAAKLPRTDFQRETSRKNMKAVLGLNCHHRNGNHNDDSQFNLSVLPHKKHSELHGKLCGNYSIPALEVQIDTEMYYGD